MSWLWAVFTVAASGGQVLRNAMQKELTATLGTVGATQVRFLFGLPFALAFLALVLAITQLPLPTLNPLMIGWTVTGAVAQTGGTALLLAVMQQRSFVVTTAHVKTEPVQVAIFGLIFLGDPGDPVTPALALAIVIATGGVLIISWPQRSSAEIFFLESSRAWTGLRGALCHCRHRLSRPRQPKLPGGCHHNPGPRPHQFKWSPSRPISSWPIARGS